MSSEIIGLLRDILKVKGEHDLETEIRELATMYDSISADSIVKTVSSLAERYRKGRDQHRKTFLRDVLDAYYLTLLSFYVHLDTTPGAEDATTRHLYALHRVLSLMHAVALLLVTLMEKYEDFVTIWVKVSGDLKTARLLRERLYQAMEMRYIVQDELLPRIDAALSEAEQDILYIVGEGEEEKRRGEEGIKAT